MNLKERIEELKEDLNQGHDMICTSALKEALEIIKELQAENEKLKAKLESMDKAATIHGKSWRNLVFKLEIATKALEFINASDSALCSAQEVWQTLKQLNSEEK